MRRFSEVRLRPMASAVEYGAGNGRSWGTEDFHGSYVSAEDFRTSVAFFRVALELGELELGVAAEVVGEAAQETFDRGGRGGLGGERLAEKLGEFGAVGGGEGGEPVLL